MKFKTKLLGLIAAKSINYCCISNRTFCILNYECHVHENEKKKDCKMIETAGMKNESAGNMHVTFSAIY